MAGPVTGQIDTGVDTEVMPCHGRDFPMRIPATEMDVVAVPVRSVSLVDHGADGDMKLWLYGDRKSVV